MIEKIRDAIANRAQDLSDQLDELVLYVPDESKVYFKVEWFDLAYPGNPHDEADTNTLEEALVWLASQSHPMGFSGCTMYISSYIDIKGEEIHIDSYDAAKLVESYRRKGKCDR